MTESERQAAIDECMIVARQRRVPEAFAYSGSRRAHKVSPLAEAAVRLEQARASAPKRYGFGSEEANAAFRSSFVEGWANMDAVLKAAAPQPSPPGLVGLPPGISPTVPMPNAAPEPPAGLFEDISLARMRAAVAKVWDRDRIL